MLLARIMVTALQVASASPESVAVTWSGPAECGDAPFEPELLRYFPPGMVVPASARVDVSVVADAEGYRLALAVQLGDTHVERTFEDRDCRALVAAAAFVAAVTIDPTAIDREPAPETAPAPEPEPAPKPAAARKPAPKPEPESKPELEPRRWFVQLAAGPSAVALPRVGALVRASGGLRGRGWRAALTASFRTPTTAPSRVFPDARGRLSSWAVGVQGCGVPSLATVEFPLCVGVEAGEVLGRGEGFEGAQTTRLPWLAIAPSAGVLWAPVPAFALLLKAEVAAPIFRHDFAIEGLDVVHRIGPVDARGLGGAEVRF